MSDQLHQADPPATPPPAGPEAELPKIPPSQPAPAPASKTAPNRGWSLVAGSDEPCPSAPDGDTFKAVSPATGAELQTEFHPATDRQLDTACARAWEAFFGVRARPAADRARLLELIAQRLRALGDALLHVASSETGLTTTRLMAERDRTVHTLLTFAEVVRRADWTQPVIDTGDPARQPVPKADLRRMLVPLGPVAVFGAGNFPLAYSTAGGDTASALAAGCPVVVKGHPAHPGTGELVARAVADAVRAAEFPPGTFSFLHSGGERERAIGAALVRHPCIRAVGFTGSLAGGLALEKIACERPDPIPVYAEMGSTNPVFVLRHALESQAKGIADKLYASFVNSNGQMCTCPGLVFVSRSDGAEALVRAIAERVEAAEPAPMLSSRTRTNFLGRVNELLRIDGLEARAGGPQAGHIPPGGVGGGAKHPILASAGLFRTTYDVFAANPTLLEEVFGPATVVVVCDADEQITEAAARFQGSLTASIFAGGYDAAVVRQLVTILEQRVGRIVFNAVPTGVEVAHAMVHGGPFPATNAPHTTAVGPNAITRWARPVCFQNAPEAMLPPELKSANPLGIRRLVDGAWTDGKLETS